MSVTMSERNGSILFLEEKFLREAIKAGVKNPEEKTKKFRTKMEVLKQQTETFSRPSLVDSQYLIQNQSPVCWYVFSDMDVGRCHDVWLQSFRSMLMCVLFCLRFRRRYNNYLTCLNSKGGVEPCADQRFLAYFSCPKTWIDEWREQREEGGYPGVKAELEPQPEPEEEESDEDDDEDDDDDDDEDDDDE